MILDGKSKRVPDGYHPGRKVFKGGGEIFVNHGSITIVGEAARDKVPKDQCLFTILDPKEWRACLSGYLSDNALRNFAFERKY